MHSWSTYTITQLAKQYKMPIPIPLFIFREGVNKCGYADR